MKLDQEKSDFLDEMLNQWQEQNLLTEEQVKKLQESYEAKSFDWRRLAQYSFWIAMACGVISLGALLVDKDILIYLQKIYDTPDSLISLVFCYCCSGYCIIPVLKAARRTRCRCSAMMPSFLLP